MLVDYQLLQSDVGTKLNTWSGPVL